MPIRLLLYMVEIWREVLYGIGSSFEFCVPIALIILLHDTIINPIKMAMKEGTVSSILIASDYYKKCLKYFKGISKEIEKLEN